MNIRRLVSIGCVGFFMFLAVTSGLAVSNSPAAVSNHPQPVRAPMAMEAPVQTTPAAPGGVTATAVHPLPQPQPVPVPPAAAATVAAPTQADAAPVSLLLLVVMVTAAFIGLMVLITNRWKVYGRFPQPSILAPGVQS